MSSVKKTSINDSKYPSGSYGIDLELASIVRKILQDISCDDLTYKHILKKLREDHKVNSRERINAIIDYLNDALIREKKKEIFRLGFL